MRFFFPMIRYLWLGLACAALALAVLGQPAQATSALERNFWLSGPGYDGSVPECDAALAAISYQFAEKESRFWNSSLEIVGFSGVHEVTFRQWASQSIPRRFCAAQAQLSDGRVRRVHYSIIEDGGFAGFNSGVEWCVVGLDRNWAYNPSCRSAKP